jgi:hypothetical protein
MKENNREGRRDTFHFKQISILHHFPAIKEGLRLTTIELSKELKALSKQP